MRNTIVIALASLALLLPASAAAVNVQPANDNGGQSGGQWGCGWGSDPIWYIPNCP
jgi:hypothetical protein